MLKKYRAGLICFIMILIPTLAAGVSDLYPDKNGIFRPIPQKEPGFNVSKRTEAVLTLLPDLKDQPGVVRSKENKTLVDGKVQPYLMLPENLLDTLYLMIHQAENMDSVEIIFKDLGKRGFQSKDRETLIERLAEDWQEAIMEKKQEIPAPWAHSVFQGISPQSQQALAAYLYEELTEFATESWPQNTY